jgi:phage gpG-like protein
LRDDVEEKAQRTMEIAIEGILSGPKTGRTWGGHQASAAGEYPANQTSQLIRSFRISREGSNQYVTRREVINDAPYAGVLEWGGLTSTGAYIAARPFLARSFDLASEELDSALDNFLAGGWP